MTDPAIRRVILFLVVVGVATWINTMPDSAAFALGVGFGLYVLPKLERWTERG